MKKSSKILGSIALSAALIMGTAAPAFADVSNPDAVSDSDMGKDETTALMVDNANKQSAVEAKDQGSSTIIQASTYTSQLSVTIPLSVPLKFDTVGGQGMAPSDNAYYIRNNSSTNITVVSAAYAIPDAQKTKWELLADPVTASSAAPSPATNVEYGDFYLGVEPTAIFADADKAKVASFALKATGSGSTINRHGGTTPLNWGITPGQTYGFKLSPSSSKLNKTLDTAATVASITYTVGVGLADNAVTGTTPVLTSPKYNLASLKSAFSDAGATLNKVYLGADSTGTDITGSEAAYTAENLKITGYATLNTSDYTWDEVAGAPTIKSGTTYRVYVEQVTE